MRFFLAIASIIVLQVSAASLALADTTAEPTPLEMPQPGSHHLRILSATVLELSLVVAKAPDPARPRQWDFVDAQGRLALPKATDFVVRAGDESIPVRTVGFKRRVLYAPIAQRDLRLQTCLYLQLNRAIAAGQSVEVLNRTLWSTNLQFRAVANPLRFNPALHVNQVGYVPDFPKIARVGYFLGNLGELEVSATNGFEIVDAQTGAKMFQGLLTARKEVGYEYKPAPYQKVLAADFTAFKVPGEYRLLVPGLGTSYPFLIHDGAAAAIARNYALGLYHQRCGTSNALPFTRFTHAPCHTAAAAVPDAKFTNTIAFLCDETVDYTNNTRHVAPQLKDFRSGRFPFVRQGKIDVAGGHHDAGDYSKYTINSAAFIHTLVFGVDAVPAIGQLDNLGLPESGDGKSDLLQEAKWEADFLAKMQDDDGGFYFLVYPAERRYENNVLPDQGDPQIVWPKNTAATAAAVAALAQCASSPRMKAQFPDAARLYLEKARKGWAFLEQAIARYGRDGAYQKLTHYGDDFMHDDELAWAACELYLATGERSFHERLLASFDPADAATRRWGWWRLYEGYGRAIRSYATAPHSAKTPKDKLDAGFLGRCEAELIAGARDQLTWARHSAYGTSFPTETKRFRGGGWYFSMDQAFDLAAVTGIQSPTAPASSEVLEAILSNLNYMAGANPVNICYLTGLGWRRPREIVHHYAINDHRILPPSGLPIGDVVAGFMWLDHYKGELGAMSFPSDGDEQAPYPIYDRWGDSFNVQTEFVIVNQARALVTAACLMARTPAKSQPSQFAPAGIEIGPQLHPADRTRRTATVKVSGRDLKQAWVVWEAQSHEPSLSPTFSFPAAEPPKWIEVEMQWPDGSRAWAATNLTVRGLK